MLGTLRDAARSDALTLTLSSANSELFLAGTYHIRSPVLPIGSSAFLLGWDPVTTPRPSRRTQPQPPNCRVRVHKQAPPLRGCVMATTAAPSAIQNQRLCCCLSGV